MGSDLESSFVSKINNRLIPICETFGDEGNELLPEFINVFGVLAFTCHGDTVESIRANCPVLW
jgi:hypothetical protein